MSPTLFIPLLALVLGYALLKGGAPERLAALIIIAASVSTVATWAPAHLRYSSVEVGIFLTDFIMMLALVALALKAERFWTLWVAAFQVMQFASHIPEILVPDLLPVTYKVVISIWSYPMLILLAIGTYRHTLRVREYGNDTSWSVSSYPS
jgi:hypothetical protein